MLTDKYVIYSNMSSPKSLNNPKYVKKTTTEQVARPTIPKFKKDINIIIKVINNIK